MKRVLTILSLLFCISIQINAQKSEVFINNGAAIRGYDAVAYFTSGKPVKGGKSFSYSWNGADWYFSSSQNLESFKNQPEKYAPQFGGYCAYGMAEGHKAPTDPDAWAIVDGKLFLNYNRDVQELWKAKQDEYIITANRNWPLLKDKE